jgi:energy-coupling factor transport system permease protein
VRGSFYRPGSTALHRFDARGKLLLALLLLVVFFLPLGPVHLAAYLAVEALLILAFLGAAELWRPVRLILPILLLVLVLTPPFHREGADLLVIRGARVVTTGGLLEAVRLMIRFTGISLLFHTLLRSTDPDTIILSFRWFGLPFSVALVLSIALEYIPYFGVLYEQVRDAHRLRQAVPPVAGPRKPGRRRRKGMRSGLSGAVPILTSVLVLSVRRIPVLAMALESRGVGRSNRRSTYHALKGGRGVALDALVAGGAAAVVVATVLLFP